MRLTMRIGAIAMLCATVAGCMLPPPTGDLRSAREACHRDYPRRIGNYLPHARCVNAAIEAYAVPTARHPDLVRMQEEIRASLSDRIDRRQLSVAAGERRMAEADRLIAAAERERDAGHNSAASKRVAAIEKILRE